MRRLQNNDAHGPLHICQGLGGLGPGHFAALLQDFIDAGDILLPLGPALPDGRQLRLKDAVQEFF